MNQLSPEPGGGGPPAAAAAAAADGPGSVVGSPKCGLIICDRLAASAVDTPMPGSTRESGLLARPVVCFVSVLNAGERTFA